MREWAVAGGIFLAEGSLLMVNNRRRNGDTDWTTPGGVIDPGETALGALTREVAEETGLSVASWRGPVYTVRAQAPSLGWDLHVQVHVAQAWRGELDVCDPDGIVFDARWVPCAQVEGLLAGQHLWMREPLLAWLAGGLPDRSEFSYLVSGSDRSSLHARRQL